MRLLPLIIALILPLSAAAKEGEDFNAVIRTHRAEFTMSSETSAKMKVHTKITVMNRHGLSAAEFFVYNDEFRQLSGFSGSIQAGGKVIKKLKKSDISTYSATDGIASGATVSVYSPSAPYPFDVEYEYTVDYSKGMVSFPAFFPISDANVSLEESEYVITAPSGTRIQYNASEEPQITKEAKVDKYIWTFNDHNGYVSEHMMPSILTLVPYVYACPVDFSYGGTKGSQETWSETGKWLYNLQEGNAEVPEELRAKIVAATEGLADKKSKIKAIYDFLRENTRYVSIQLGIGGFKPFPVETVYKTGFGDCKALSAYMQALLKVAGIDSEYYIISTSRGKLIKDYHSVGQMNHAMLCVPMEKDTLWVECTNPRYPLGYRHESAAGHQVVLVKEDGGEMVRIPDYPDSLSFRSESVDVILKADGGAECTGSRFLKLDNVESYLSFSSYKPKDQFDVIMSGNSLNPSDFKIVSVKDNFNGWLECDGEYVPEIKIDYSYKVTGYATRSGGRMFLQLNPFSKKLYADRKKRVNPMMTSSGTTYADTVNLILPDGYIPETIPASSTIESKFGTFRTEVKYTPAGEGRPAEIQAVQTMTFVPFKGEPEEYEQYRAFAKEVSNAYSARIVLISSQ